MRVLNAGVEFSGARSIVLPLSLQKAKAGTKNENQIQDAGQNFQGEIIGDAETLQKLRAGLKLDGDTLTAYVGRSRFTQYGKCRFTFDAPKEIPAQDVAEKIYLRLETPLIPAAGTVFELSAK